MKNICYEMTDKCLLKCPYCISSDNGSLLEEHHEEIIDFIGALHPERVVLSGGEPLIDPNLKNKITMLKEKYHEQGLEPYISLSTSGACTIKNELLEFLKDNIQCFDISIPSLNRHTYEQMRGYDLLTCALVNAKKAADKGLNVRISVTVTKQNINELEHILAFAEKIKANSVRLGRYFPFRNANKVRDNYEVDEKDLMSLIADIENNKFSHIFSGKIIPPIKSLEMMNGYLTIDFNKNVFVPSESGKQVIGSIDTVSIEDLNSLFEKPQQDIFIKSKELPNEIFKNN